MGYKPIYRINGKGNTLRNKLKNYFGEYTIGAFLSALVLTSGIVILFWVLGFWPSPIGWLIALLPSLALYRNVRITQKNPEWFNEDFKESSKAALYMYIVGWLLVNIALLCVRVWL
jgi:hypothetical protein